MKAAGGILDRILASTRLRVERLKEEEPQRVLKRRIARMSRPPRHFLEVFAGDSAAPRVIAEFKRASPSEGAYAMARDPIRTATGYARSGAAAISVLTEPEFFAGSLEHLAAICAKVDLPLLMKDFVIDPYQLLLARAYGADAVLLIASALKGTALDRMMREAHSLRLATLVEVHDAPELERAFGAGARLIGVNSRNLRTFAVDLEGACRLAERHRDADARLICESGIRTRRDLATVLSAGFAGCLVGTSLMKADDPGAALGDLLAPEGTVS